VVSLGEWVNTGSPIGGGGALVTLPDGTAALFASGQPVQIYHPETGAWTERGSLPAIPFTGVTLLNSAHVLVIAADSILYDPATGAVTPTGAMNVARNGHSATLLASGKVLVSGGLDANNALVGPAEIFDPVAGTWSLTGALNQLRTTHAAALLPNGKVLVAGGSGLSGPLASAEIYDPITGAWTPATTMSQPRSLAVGVALHDGRVLVVGSASSAVYDPVANVWGADVAVSRASSQALVVLQDGTPLLVTLQIVACNIPFAGCPVMNAALFDVHAGAWTPTATPSPQYGLALTVLADGRALEAGSRPARLFRPDNTTARLVVSPPTIAFGKTSPGMVVQVPVNLQNTGGATLTGSVVTAAPFSIISGSPFAVAPGASAAVTVRFTPPGFGSFSGVVQFMSNGNWLSVPVAGETGVRLSGRVADVVGAGVGGVTVNLSGAAVASTVTDAAGSYDFFVQPNNGYNVTPTSPGLAFTPSTSSVIVGTQDVSALDFTATLSPERIGVFRDGLWFLDLNGNDQWDGCGVDSCLGFGLPGDKPVASDWTGTGTAKIGVFRNGTWSLDLNGNGLWDGCDGDACPDFGQPGDEPVAGDWNATGHAKIGVFRNGSWFLDLNGNGQWDGCITDGCLGFGLPGDLPVVGDWTGTGLAELGVFRNGLWFLDLNGNGQWDGCAIDACFGFGLAGDLPVVGDWTGTGHARIGVFRDGVWYLDLNGNGQWDGCVVDACVGFGLASDRAIVGNW
jgi:hypothetical protein